jgi:hypothetical protein
VSVDSSLHMALMPCTGCCGEFDANVHASQANSFVRDGSVVLFQGGFVGGNVVSGIPRNSCAVCPSRPSWSIVNGMRAQLRSVLIVAIVSICVADVVVFPWCFSFMDAMCYLSAKNTRVFKLIRRSSSPWGGAVSDGGCWGTVMSRSCSFATGWFVCFAGGERRIMMSAGRLAGASGMSPVGSTTVSCAVFVWLVSVSNGRSVIANVFVMALCSVVLRGLHVCRMWCHTCIFRVDGGWAVAACVA